MDFGLGTLHEVGKGILGYGDGFAVNTWKDDMTIHV